MYSLHSLYGQLDGGHLLILVLNDLSDVILLISSGTIDHMGKGLCTISNSEYIS